MKSTWGYLFALCMTAAVAQDEGSGSAASKSWTESDVDRLAALEPAERRAQLKAMDPQERRGLWFAVKAKVNANRGIERTPGSYRSAVSAAAPTATPKAPTAADAKAIAGGPVSGRIQYDSGPFNTTFGGGAIIGNRFNSADGRNFQDGSVTAVQAVVVQGGAFSSSSAGFVVLGPQTGGGGAMAVFSTFTNAAGVTDTVDFTGIAAGFTGASYFVLFGDFANSYVPAFGTGTTLNQGRHGIVGYTGGMGPNITGTFDFGGALNAFVRSSSNVVPVELLP